jgi:hypothetical protein
LRISAVRWRAISYRPAASKSPQNSRLRFPTSVVPNTSGWSPAKVPEKTRWRLPGHRIAGGQRDRRAAYADWCAVRPSGAVAAGVGAGRPEIGTAAEKPAVAQDQHATVSAMRAVEHMDVKGIEPVLYGPGTGRVRPVFRSRRNPMLGFFLGGKITNMGIRAMARYDRHKPAAGFAHLGRELRFFSHSQNMRSDSSLLTAGSDKVSTVSQCERLPSRSPARQ